MAVFPGPELFLHLPASPAPAVFVVGGKASSKIHHATLLFGCLP